MTDGIVDCRADLKWLLAAGMEPRAKVDVMTSALNGVALWYAFELTRNPDSADMLVDDEGHFLIALNDDVNFGWCHYRKRVESDDIALQEVVKKFGAVVQVPICAMLSTQPVGIY